jgi:hypothetical protein
MFSNVRTIPLHRVLALLCLLTGCAGADPAEHFCSAANKREEKCHAGSGLIDDATCARVLQCDHALYVPESDGVRLRCAAAFADASCSDQPSSLMECDLELLRQAVSGMKRTTARESFEAGCLAKAAECQELGIDIMPVCNTASAMTDAMNSAMQRCNQGDCQQYGRCVAEEMSNAYETCLRSVPQD